MFLAMETQSFKGIILKAHPGKNTSGATSVPGSVLSGMTSVLPNWGRGEAFYFVAIFKLYCLKDWKQNKSLIFSVIAFKRKHTFMMVMMTVVLLCIMQHCHNVKQSGFHSPVSQRFSLACHAVAWEMGNNSNSIFFFKKDTFSFRKRSGKF